jgi:hypothetical protein
MRQFYFGAEWDVYEVRYVWEHDGVFVRTGGPQLEAPNSRNAMRYNDTDEELAQCNKVIDLETSHDYHHNGG